MRKSLEHSALSSIARNRITSLESQRDAHLSRAVRLEAAGRTLPAWEQRQAANAVNYRLAVIKRKLAELDFARRNHG